VISCNLGQPIDTDRYHSLRASVEELAEDEAFSEIEVKPIAETRSGSGISAISVPDGDDNDYVAIFKDGEKRKLKEERAGVESWHEIFPGLAPRILSYKKRGQSASLLIEHLAGLTFEQILLHEPQALVKETLDQLGKTLGNIWNETRTEKPVSAEFMRQLSRRLDEVYAIHPEFRQGSSTICGYTVPSFDELLRRAAEYEASVRAPFSVYIHGDFNVDNIIYDPLEKRINYIDLHRSRHMDYVQDVSVFMVSNYRLQVLDKQLRKRILGLIRDFYRIARAFARKTGDVSFEVRLALGLARSFVTSTRFILDKSLARAMFLRARYLLERVLVTEKKKVAAFRVPIKEIFVG
jgi:aminoglycoside phosphotransferase (APT) family kinase protein